MENFNSTINFNGRKLTIAWSFHALRRAEERLDMNEIEVDAVLRHSLRKASRNSSVQTAIPNISGDWIVYDAEDAYTFVLSSGPGDIVHVISCGKSDIHPRDGSLTLQINNKGMVRLVCWTKPNAARVASGLVRTLNGRKLKVFWVGECAKMAQDPRKLRILKNQLCKTTLWLAHSGYLLVEGKTLNVWNWQTHSFFSINIHPRDDEVDVMLYRTAQFQCKKDCIRIDITQHGCEYLIPFVRNSKTRRLAYA